MKLEIQGAIATLEFDHGKANEMGRAELETLRELGTRLNGVQGLISFSRRISSRGTPIFISGANVTEREEWSDDEIKAHVRFQRSVLYAVRTLPLFHVTVVHGVALGWGTEWMLTADYRIATPGASFGLPETGLGIIPGAGGSADLVSLIGLPQALRLGMTGERLTATEALRIGLVQEVADNVEVGLDRARALAFMVMRKSPTAVAAFKRAALACIGESPRMRQEIEAKAYEHCVDSGEAAVGRQHFKDILAGAPAPWGELKRFCADHEPEGRFGAALGKQRRSD